MIAFKTIAFFRKRLLELKTSKKGIYSTVDEEIKKEFVDKSIEEIRQNNDMILICDELIVIKLRLPDKKHHLSKKDGFRLIYLVSKTVDVVVFLDIYPKNGPLQQLNESNEQLTELIKSFNKECIHELLEVFCLDVNK